MEIELAEYQNYNSIIGCDEVGRGPIAGPLNAAAVVIDKSQVELLAKLRELNITDSKKLTDKKRKKILGLLQIDTGKIKLGEVYHNEVLGAKFSFCVTEHSPAEIDKLNILQASLSAMKTASENLLLDSALSSQTIILIDGNKSFESSIDRKPIVKGDSKAVTIGLASIIAKVFRDEKMAGYDAKYPGYNLAQHAGYPTKEHRDAVKNIGPSPIHRKSFKGVKEYLS